MNGLLVIPALYLAIAIHELAHLLVGKFAGLESGGVAIGGFVFLKSGQHWTVRFNWRSWAGGYFKPITKAGELPLARYAWTVAAGPLASLACAVACVVFLSWFDRDEWHAVGTLFWVSLFISLSAGIPSSTGLRKSDGALLWTLLHDPQGTRFWLTLIQLQTQETRGKRPRDWDILQIEEILRVPPSSNLYVISQLMAFYFFLDRRADETAVGHLENVLAKAHLLPVVFRQQIYLEAAGLAAEIRRNPVQARTWRMRACKPRKPESLDVTDASIAMCEGRYADALKYWDAAHARVTKRKLDSGVARFARERWLEYQALCRAEISAR